MPLDYAPIKCHTHGDAYATFICGHLAANPAQEWFSQVPSEDNPWPDSWCAECDVEYMKLREWNDDNSHCLEIKTLCHECYQYARAQGTFDPAPEDES